MNIYQIIFAALFLWSSIYTISLSVYNFRTKDIFSAINSVILVSVSGVLFVIYLAL